MGAFSQRTLALPNIKHKKSQLAIEHCYRTAEQSPKPWVFWAHAGNTARLEQSFREIADQAKVRGRRGPQVDIFKLVHDWLRDERNGPWLVVIDNADDTAVLQSSANNSTNDGRNILKHHLSRYLPPTRHGVVLMTSRTRRTALQMVEDDDIIPIESMHDTDARALLLSKLGDKVDKGNDVDRGNDIDKLAAALDHMPLALVQAAAYIRRRAPRCSVRQYLEQYRQSDSRKTSLLNQEAGHLRRDETASNSVLITWQISFDHVKRERQSAADLLSLMSFFDRQGIPESVLRDQNTDDDSFETDLLTLRDYSFITPTKDTSTFEMHNLVQLATLKWLENQDQVDKWRNQFVARLCAELPTGEYSNWEKCQVLFPHARAALAQRPKGALKEWALLLYNAVWYACRVGKVGEAEYMSVTSMEVNKELYGEESRETLGSMSMVGLARKLRGRYNEAESICRQALVLQEKVLGVEHYIH